MHEKTLSALSVTSSQPRTQILGAVDVANATALTWQDIDKALSPLVGKRAVAALYQRSLCLIASAYPWLPCPLPGADALMDLDALQAAMVLQGGIEAAAASEALFGAFTGLLTSLVGDSLTKRLLRSVRANTSSGLAAQGGSP